MATPRIGLWGDLRVQYKFQLLAQLVLIAILVAAQFLLTRHFEDQVMRSAKIRADAVADDLVNALNGLMIGEIAGDSIISNKKVRAAFLQQMARSAELEEVRVIRGPGLAKEYDEGLPQEQPVDDLDRQVLKTGQSAYETIKGKDGGMALRSVLPYIAGKDVRGVNCLKCHEVSEGEVLGATSIVISLKEDMETIARVNRMLWLGQAMLQVLLFFVIGAVTRQAIATPLARLRDAIASITSSKDFTSRVDIAGGDELGQTAEAYNQMIAEVQAALRDIQASMIELRGASANVAASAQLVVSESTRQENSGATMAGSVEKLNASMEQVASSTNGVLSETKRSGDISEEGKLIIDEAVAEMDKIANAVAEASTVITSLGEQSQRITTVVQVIREIADQTNLLALNAAIEAARAGESGRGFAVVADEVRKLAERTAQSTSEIHSLVSAIQGGSTAAVAEIRLVIDKVQSGQVSVAKVGTKIMEIRDQGAKVAHLMSGISDAMRDESAFCKVIDENVAQLAAMARDAKGTAGSLFKDAERLDDVANRVAQAASAFKV